MDKGYYWENTLYNRQYSHVVAIHNKNGQGLLHNFVTEKDAECIKSQSTIKMEKGYYQNSAQFHQNKLSSQSTIKMEKGYY